MGFYACGVENAPRKNRWRFPVNAEAFAPPVGARRMAETALAPLHAAACTYRIALGPRAGQKVLTWKDPALRSASPPTISPNSHLPSFHCLRSITQRKDFALFFLRRVTHGSHSQRRPPYPQTSKFRTSILHDD